MRKAVIGLECRSAFIASRLITMHIKHIMHFMSDVLDL